MVNSLICESRSFKKKNALFLKDSHFLFLLVNNCDDIIKTNKQFVTLRYIFKIILILCDKMKNFANINLLFCFHLKTLKLL